MAHEITRIDHPLVATWMSILREKSTGRPLFRTALDQLASVLVYEATRDLRTRERSIETPLTTTIGAELADDVLFVPVLRAGLGMLDAATKLIPEADVGFLGMARDERTHLPTTYMKSLPEDLSGKRVLVLDPMLATGGSTRACVEVLRSHRASLITVVCVLAAPEGLASLGELGGELRVVTASIDERLNGDAFIVPGLGDAGDRQFGER